MSSAHQGEREGCFHRGEAMLKILFIIIGIAASYSAAFLSMIYVWQAEGSLVYYGFGVLLYLFSWLILLGSSWFLAKAYWKKAKTHNGLKRLVTR